VSDRQGAFRIRKLAPGDAAHLEACSRMFAEAFAEPEMYGAARPGREYLERLLGNEHFIALAALEEGAVVGALAAYELPKFEQERSEIYIYDLAVAEGYRRKGSRPR
jgi:aminoglycoside 3-N-acetyltransferase I